MVISVADSDGTILAIFRMPDATIFSIDVSASKARNVVYFGSPRVNPADLPGVPPGIAVTNRTIGFGAMLFHRHRRRCPAGLRRVRSGRDRAVLARA